jgi:hypothetical protein
MRDSTGFLARIKEYIEQREEKIEGEWGNCRSLKKLIADGDMPDVYFEVLQLMNSVNPIPISERMPEPKDCNGSGMFWAWAENVDNVWELTDRDGMNWENFHHHGYTHWLPYWALPLPSPPNQHG